MGDTINTNYIRKKTSKSYSSCVKDVLTKLQKKIKQFLDNLWKFALYAPIKELLMDNSHITINLSSNNKPNIPFPNKTTDGSRNRTSTITPPTEALSKSPLPTTTTITKAITTSSSLTVT